MGRIAALLLFFLATRTQAGEARWIRYPAISPDGRWIAFSYRGDLWRVAAGGGEARPLTSHVGYERSPVWSPDSRRIAFASDRHGNFDVFVMDRDGGAATRLTFHSANDTPSAFSRDQGRVIFSSRRRDAPEASIGPAWVGELYAIPVDGGRPKQLLTTPAERARFSPDGGRMVYQDWKGWENYWRKHHVSAVTRDIWVYDRASKTHTRMTRWRGEDRDPVWVTDGIFFLSERGGSFNVYKLAEPPVQVTKHARHPVRFLSAADDGTLCYAYNGELWTRRGDQKPMRIAVEAHAGAKVNVAEAITLKKGATGFAVSPDESEIAFVARGEVFVASVKHGTTKRITSTAEQERSVVWMPDGKTLVYAAEREGSWNLYKTSRTRDEEPYFFLATTLKEEPLLVTGDDTYQPLVSPDGKQLAFLRNRDTLCVLDLATKVAKVVLPGRFNYSYSDGDVKYEWSPDSRYLLTGYIAPGRWIDDVAIVDVAQAKATNMSLSGYHESQPQWSPRGDAVLFRSDRLGRRSHGSWGSDGDVFALYLTQAAFDRARLPEEDFELLRKQEKEAKKKNKAGKKEEGGKRAKKKVEPVRIEFAGIEKRTRRLTLHSAPMGGYALSPDGETLVYFARVDEKWDLWIHAIRKSETRRLLKVRGDRAGEVKFNGKGDAVFVRTGKGLLKRVPLKGDAKPIPYAGEMIVDHARERAYIFEHVWRQTRAKFYDPALHRVDWEAVRENYASFLDHISHGRDFAELLSEMVGELNASHTGSGYRKQLEGADKTAALGLLFDVRHEGAGLKVVEVIEEGPVDRAGESVTPGSLLTHIDGIALTARTNPAALLNRKAGKRVLLGFAAPGGKAFERVVKPIDMGREANLLYKRWVKQRREMTGRLSKGRLGYVHVRGMNERSFRHVFRDALGRHRAKLGLIVDTRFNGGGWLHDDLVVFLGGKRYVTFAPPGKPKGIYGGEPLHRWAKPVVVLQNEANYSDGHFFPYAFKQLGLGKLVGAPIAGTATAVWWERQIDGATTYGIPQIGMLTPGGRYLENLELRPHVEVYNDPESAAAGRDLQLEKAVEVLLEEVGW